MLAIIAMIRNFVNGILTYCERRIAFYEGYNLCNTISVNWEEVDSTGKYSEAAKRYNCVNSYKGWNDYKVN